MLFRPFMPAISATAALLTWSLLSLSAQTPATAKLESEALAPLALRTIGPANMSGRVVDLAVVESDPSTFYVASATGGLWKTSNNGVTFQGLFERETVHSIGALAIFQPRPEIVWLGTGERANRQSSSWGDGIYKSLDGGKTWTNMGLRDSHHIARIATNPSNAEEVYVAALGHLWGPNRERGLYKTSDGGRTWTNVLFIDENTGVTDVAMDPSDPATLYAAAYQRRRRAFGFHGGGPGSGLYKSTDAGRTWKKLTAGLPTGVLGRIGISIYRANPRIVYVSIEQGERYNASTAYEVRKAGVYRSEDRGESWTFMSDWNPRPMYASQILVDPNDDQRIYMVNEFSYSTDGGKTFTSPRQSLHGDDRVVWVNPKNSNHVMKGDDGGLGISYDRGVKWLFVTSLPISQFYRVAVDMQKPFGVCGGLQDNGSWCGPSGTYFSSGVLNEDWFRVGGGDGFVNLIDPTDHTTVYSASQYLGLTRVDTNSRESRDIRPGDPKGHIAERRNWKTWGQPGAAEPLLGNAMAPANWDAPFILSPHDPKTIYAGTNELWRSTDRGETWVSLGRRTTGIDRSSLTIMSQKPGPSTLSLDDGIPYYPTLTAIAESPLQKGLLYVGTDDGNLQVSRDAGKSWTNVAGNIPALPKSSWVSGIEASRHAEGTVYAAFDNHASDDFRNYLFKSEDHGRSWKSITGDLPPNRVVKAVHEDPRNPNLVYVGTEFGFFLSLDGGGHWVQLKNNLPTVPINDFVIHPRDNDLVLATHGRGVWILENIAPLQEWTTAQLHDAYLFAIEPADMIRYSESKAHQGDMVFRGENPPAGMIIDYYLKNGGDWTIDIQFKRAGSSIGFRLPAERSPGLHRMVWGMRIGSEGMPVGQPQRERRPTRGLQGAFVEPGEYTVRLVSGSAFLSVPRAPSVTAPLERRVRVSDDPRVRVSPDDRRVWTDALTRLAATHNYASMALNEIRVYADPDRPMTPPLPADLAASGVELSNTLRELVRRLQSLHSAVSGWTGPLTADQRAQTEYYGSVLADLQARVRAFRDQANRLPR